MKLIHKDPLPACDICKAATAFCDAPAKPRGTWAYMCLPCHKIHAATSADRVGFMFCSEPRDCTIRQEKIALAVEDGDMDLAISLTWNDGDLLDYI